MFFCRIGARAAAIIAAIIFLQNSIAAAQQAPAPAYPTTRAARIEPAEAPTIDGDLSDPVWAKATVIWDFHQLEPVTGAPPSERTVLRLMYDENSLYFSVYAYDSEPDQIIVRSMARDGELYTGDNISVTLDPGMTRRNAYSFELGPSGGRGDSLMLNNTSDLEEWDPTWTARARRVVDGWVAEFAIPFASLSFPGAGDWGFEFQREIRRKAEDIRWSSMNRNLEFTDVSQSGILTGIENISQGVGLDLQLYAAMQSKRDWHIPGDETGISFTGGGNAFYRLTPALTGTLTYNPDFSDAPLDARQVNTSRFSLFTPETRDFFLQDAGAFEFGGRAFSRGFFDRDVNNGRPFFSRNLGLVGGRQVSIVGGGKLSGEHAGFGIGALSVLTDKTSTSDGQLLSVARVTRAIGGHRIGAIVTHGDPTGLTDNTVLGGDFQFRDENFLGGGLVVADIFYQQSFSDTVGDDSSFGFAATSPNDPWFWNAAIKQVGENYAPALGFVNRKAIRLYEGEFGHITRFDNQWLRQMDIATENILFTDLNDNIESRDSEIGLEFETGTEDQFGISLNNFYEDVPEAFDLPGDVPIPIGDYNWTNVEANFSSAEGRMFSIGVDVTCCAFYNGRALQSELEFNFRPNAYFAMGTSYEYSNFDMPGGQTDVHLIEAQATVNFMPDMELRLQAQYDNDSEAFGFLARYRWEFIPGGDLFISFGQAARIPQSGFEAERSQFSLRLGHTFRF